MWYAIVQDYEDGVIAKLCKHKCTLYTVYTHPHPHFLFKIKLRYTQFRNNAINRIFSAI